jgi:hypothetical protein
MLRIHNSALKHGCSREDISHAVDMALYSTVLDEDADPAKVLIIGPDGAANILELVGGELDDELWIWHAMRCRPTYLELLPKAGGNG